MKHNLMTFSNFGTNCYDYPCGSAFGWVFKIGQPTVIGEIIAGIVLGPSLLGMYFPGFLLLCSR
jgi:hypothetical protein